MHLGNVEIHSGKYLFTTTPTQISNHLCGNTGIESQSNLELKFC